MLNVNHYRVVVFVIRVMLDDIVNDVCHFNYYNNVLMTTFLACERGWYGPGCIHRCDCHNGATCDGRTGACLCGMGITGKLCDQGLYD
jgi:hypothetical protein